MVLVLLESCVKGWRDGLLRVCVPPVLVQSSAWRLLASTRLIASSSAHLSLGTLLGGDGELGEPRFVVDSRLFGQPQHPVDPAEAG